MIWQTENWQQMLQASGQVQKTISFQLGGKDFFVEKRSLSLGQIGLFLLGVETTLICDELQQALVALCQQEQALFIQIETYDYAEDVPLMSGIFQPGYFKKFITPYTAIIDLHQNEEAVLANMKPKGRYNIRLAQKKGVEVTEVEKTPENIKIFAELVTETAQRDSFSASTSTEYYTEFLGQGDHVKLLFASFEGKVISAGIFTYDKQVAIYYYGASTSEKKYRKYMAPYLLQWRGIEIAKQLQCEVYDFLGVSTPGKNDELSGVTSFKLKFTPDVRHVSGAYLYTPKPLKYKVLMMLRRLQKSIKK